MLEIPHRGVATDMLGDVRPSSANRIIVLQETVDATIVPTSVARFIITVVRNTRELPGVVLGASPRSAIHLLTAAKAKARLSGRDHVASRTSWRWHRTSCGTGSSAKERPPRTS